MRVSGVDRMSSLASDLKRFRKKLPTSDVGVYLWAINNAEVCQLLFRHSLNIWPTPHSLVYASYKTDCRLNIFPNTAMDYFFFINCFKLFNLFVQLRAQFQTEANMSCKKLIIILTALLLPCA